VGGRSEGDQRKGGSWHQGRDPVGRGERGTRCFFTARAVAALRVVVRVYTLLAPWARARLDAALCPTFPPRSLRLSFKRRALRRASDWMFAHTYGRHAERPSGRHDAGPRSRRRHRCRHDIHCARRKQFMPAHPFTIAS
jgi:hypothetical protein